LKHVLFVLLAILSAIPVIADKAPMVDKLGLNVTDAYLRTMPPGQRVTAGFLTISNNGNEDCQILSATSPFSERIEFHQHLHANGRMQMRPLAQVLVTAGKTVKFSPGGLHLMFFDVTKPLVENEILPMRLLTDYCGTYLVNLQIRNLLQRPMMEH
jgi:copper(I)-binding protein